jgi:hypothetical protein
MKDERAELTGCACRWDKDDNRVQTCTRHQGWLDVVHEWAERAKSAEQQAAALLAADAQGGEVVALGDEWTPCVKLPITVHVRKQRPGETHVSTREGITPVRPDDLIMRGVQGEEYPIGRELWEKTYTTDTHPQPQAVPHGWKLVPVEALVRWRAAFAEELAAYDIDPPMSHIKAGHDEIDALLAASPAAPPAMAQATLDRLVARALGVVSVRNCRDWGNAARSEQQKEKE